MSMTLDTAMLLAAGIFLLIQGGFGVRWWIRRRRLHCPIVPTRLDAPINIDVYRPTQKQKLAKLGQRQDRGWDARKVNR